METVFLYGIALNSPAAQLVRQKLQTIKLTGEKAPKAVEDSDISAIKQLTNVRTM